jgi:hypothetical protein
MAMSHQTGPANATIADPQTHVGTPPSPEKAACWATVCPNGNLPLDPHVSASAAAAELTTAAVQCGIADSCFINIGMT